MRRHRAERAGSGRGLFAGRAAIPAPTTRRSAVAGRSRASAQESRPNCRVKAPPVPRAAPEKRASRPGPRPSQPGSRPSYGGARPSRPGSRGAPPPNSRSRRGPAPVPRTRAALGGWLARFRLLTGIIVVIAASVLVAWGARRFLRTSPRFAIKTIVVDGNQRRTAQQIAKQGGVAVGQNVFALDLPAAEQAIAADPWVKSATVNRELPNEVRIQVTEREARALAVVDGELLLVDSSGELFKRLRKGDPTDLVVITGIEPAALARDLEGVTERLRRILDLLGELERVGIARRYPIQEVHLEPDDSAVVTIGSDGVAIAMGRPPYRAKVEKVDRILVEVARRKAKPDVLFLDDEAHPERVVVRMR